VTSALRPDRRRLLLAPAAAALCLRVGAEGTVRAYRIGVLGPDGSDASGPTWEAFVDELSQRGYVQGRNLVLERRFGEGDRIDLLDRYAAELVAQKVDLIYAVRGNASALAAKKATATVPIVFYSSNDPVGVGLVSSLPRPGGNVTGNATLGSDVVAKGLELLAQAAGKLTQFVLFVPAGIRALGWFAKSEAALVEAGARLGAKAHFVEVREVDEMAALVQRLERQGIDAALLFDFPLFRPHQERIAALFIEHRLPSYGYARAGFLLHHDVSRPQLARNAAAYVDRILKGARPADLPVEQVKVFQLAINLKTAKALGLTIPPSLMLRADEVIE
jgi:putative ABC transport system substrate-binding protein